MSSPARARWSGALSWLVLALAVSFPLLRLWPLDAHFGTDWYNHKWLTAYFGEYLREHGSIPVVVHSTRWCGMATGVFYGALLYPLLALPATWIHPGVVLRGAVVLVTALQLRLVALALVRLDMRPWLARGVACLVIWTIYPLTNLYNRSAITEFIATALLTCAAATWFLLVHARDTEERTRLGLGFGLLFVLVAGCHPITALYSLPILALLLVAAYAEHGRSAAFWWGLVKALALPVVLTVVVLSPWLYALASYQRFLHTGGTTEGLPWFYPKIDSLATRFAPLPYDPQITSRTALRHAQTPYLDAQLNVALLVLLLGWFALWAWRHRKDGFAALRVCAPGLVAGAVFLVLSLSPAVYAYLPSQMRLVQIAYRLITYSNLAVLITVLMLAGFLRRRGDPTLRDGSRWIAAILIGCLALSALGVAIKWKHATAVVQYHGAATLRTLRSERARWIALPAQYYGYDDYTTAALYPERDPGARPTREVSFAVGTGDEFGEPQPLHVTLDADAWLATNVEVFPWNRIVLDGTELPDADLRRDGPRFVVAAAAGAHTLELQTDPAPTWVALRTLSFAVLALWATALIWLHARAWWRARRASRHGGSENSRVLA